MAEDGAFESLMQLLQSVA